MGTQHRTEHTKFNGRWSGMVALFRTVVGVSIVSGLLVVLLWSEQQVGVKTPAHTHFHAHARGIPDNSQAEGEGAQPEVEEEFETVTERLEPRPPAFPSNEHTATNAVLSASTSRRASVSFRSASGTPSAAERGSGTSFSSSLSSSSSSSFSSSSSSLSSSSSSSSSISSSTSSSKQNRNVSEAKLVFTIDQDPSSGSGGGSGGGGSSSSTIGPYYPKIYVITPTYRRPEQVAELTRLSQTLMLVPNLHWLVAEDAVAPTRQVLAFLESCSVPHTYLLGRSSRRYKGASKPRGVSNRNAGLKWLKAHASEGVIYFADDDNTYDYRIFQEIRVTRQVSMFPVGLVTRLGVSSPIVAEGKVIGFYDGWIAGRKFPVDMAGFAVNVKFYLERRAPLMPYSVGFEEDGFLKALQFSPGDIEPLADNCTKILVWHTRTVKSLPAVKMPESDKVLKTNLKHLRSQMVFQIPFGVS
ncbi:galactosylgalactosylxylosylprotein 3-beta-glucuronosyltransferase P-like [Penaeus japonicus]|uniref:galactosylgalactosylxylosylprotein 3-beta-glucuronosyltransferase P-like n=1 Tax=Penaeus japonicus TaxID=27405 RepID=UPI001C70D0B2|nr:galactosylgalactosylxylosylprotein 3-beta-glucuronosyltransferase P-like [Penaeus japonicus]